jgi:hypothetical protein
MDFRIFRSAGMGLKRMTALYDLINAFRTLSPCMYPIAFLEGPLQTERAIFIQICVALLIIQGVRSQPRSK